MKKLSALFLGCIMIAGTFASCGKNDSSSKTESDPLVGKWNMEDTSDGFNMIMDFKGETLDLETDFSRVLYFTDKDAIIEGDNYGSNVTSFEDNKLSVTVQGNEIITMTRFEGEGDSLDGTYNELSGILPSQFSAGDDIETLVRIDGQKLYVIYSDFCKYTVDGDEITLKNAPAAILSTSESDEAVMTFKINGDTLTLTDKNDSVQTLTRVK